MPRQYLTETQVMRVITLLGEGNSQRYIAGQMGVSRSVIQRAVSRYRDTGGLGRRPGQGRKRITTPRQDRSIVRNVLRRRTTLAKEAQTHLRQDQNVQISTDTVRNRLHETGLSSRRPARGPALKNQHRRARLAYTRRYGEWRQRQWGRVWFTDESRFSLCGNDGRLRIWRRRGERYEQNLFEPTRSHNGGSIMVWGGISINGRTDLVVVPPPGMNAQRYIDEILRPHVLPLRERHGGRFILMQDNARPHTARVTQNFLLENDITLSNHPSMSPDLNPIEHVWDMGGTRLRSCPVQPWCK